MYPNFPGGWKLCLEAAAHHHNNSHNKAIGCTPHFALHGTPPLLHAIQHLGIAETITLKEQCKIPSEIHHHRLAMKKQFDRHHSHRIPNIVVGDLIIVRNGLLGTREPPQGPFTVVQTAPKQGVLKTVGYSTQDNHTHIASINNVSEYHPRRDESSTPGPM